MKVKLLKKLRKMYVKTYNMSINASSRKTRDEMSKRLIPSSSYTVSQLVHLNDLHARLHTHSAKWLEANRSKFYVFVKRKPYDPPSISDHWESTRHLDAEQIALTDRMLDRGMYREFKKKWEKRSRKYNSSSAKLLRSISKGEKA